MVENRMGFFARLWLAFWLPWVLVFNGFIARRVRLAAAGDALPALAPPDEAPPALKEAKEPAPAAPNVAAPETAPALAVPAPLAPEKPGPEPALHLLAILQREGRFVDFLMEDVRGAADDQLGAAARVVHDGCRKALSQYFTLEPVRPEPEDAPITVEAGFDAARIRLTGNVVGRPPYRGRLAHHGWQAAEVRLPALGAGQDPGIIAPAEVEL